jgi:response regulator RpfG family c-di-GMP phosphodiesterase
LIRKIVDLVNPQLADHHKRVASTAYNLCSELGLPSSETADITFAGALDLELVELLEDMYHNINSIRVDAQCMAEKEYRNFTC